jgi:hypothetical protein
MKSKPKAGALWRQGDVLFKRIPRLPKGERKERANGVVAYGEVTGHSHALAVEDQDVAEVLEIEKGLYVHIRKSGISIEDKKGATFVHQEHAPVTLPPGNYQVRIQREYTPGAVRHVVD